MLATLTEDEKRALLHELQDQTLRPQVQTEPRTSAHSAFADGIDLLWLLDHLPSMVAFWDRDQRCRYANAAYLKWFGASQAKMANITLSELLGPLYDLNRSFIEGALRGVPQQFERTIPDPRGGPSRHSLAHYLPDIRDGEVKGFVALVHDVTELRQLSLTLQERAAEISSLFEVLPVGVLTLDSAGNVLTMNKALASILGLTESAIKRGDFRSRTYFRPDGSQVMPDEFPGTRTIKMQEPVGPVELGFTNSDNVMVWMSVSAVPIVSRKAACIVVARDITQERNLQLSLERSNQRFRAILVAMPVPLAMNDDAGRITYLNPAFTQTFEYTIEDIPSLDAWWQLSHPNAEVRRRVASDWLARLERAKRERCAFEPVELAVATKRGETRIVVGSAAALSGTFDGEHLVVLFDITKQTHAEAFLRNVLDSALDGIITIDEEQRIVTFSAGAEKMFECPAGSAIGESLDRFLPERIRQQHASLVRDFAEEGTSARVMAASKRRSPLERARLVMGCRIDGEEFPISASISQVCIGERRYFTVVCRDITEQVRAERAREQLEAQLRQLQKTEVIGRFSGGIAHDFNNILTAIMGLTSMVLATHASDSDLSEKLNAILDATKRGAQLTRQLLSLSRPSPVEFRPIAIDAIVKEVSMLLRSAMPRNIQLETKAGRGLAPILGDSGQVHQVLLNLCSNAVHAMRPSGGHLRISVENWRGSSRPGLAERDFIRMSVHDTGHGIPKESVSRVFEPFYTTKKHGEGTGLGLAVVRTIVESHAGTIGIETKAGGPTTFWVLWPTMDASMQPASVLSKQREPHVLFLDDDELACRVGEQILRRHGYLVTSFHDPEDAWTRLSAAPMAFDVVVTDLSMPKLTGMEFAQRMVKAGLVLPIVLCTGNPGTLSSPTLLAAGIQELLLKPMTARELLDAVARALAARRTEKESQQVSQRIRVQSPQGVMTDE